MLCFGSSYYGATSKREKTEKPRYVIQHKPISVSCIEFLALWYTLVCTSHVSYFGELRWKIRTGRMLTFLEFLGDGHFYAIVITQTSKRGWPVGTAARPFFSSIFSWYATTQCPALKLISSRKIHTPSLWLSPFRRTDESFKVRHDCRVFTSWYMILYCF